MKKWKRKSRQKCPYQAQAHRPWFGQSLVFTLQRMCRSGFTPPTMPSLDDLANVQPMPRELVEPLYHLTSHQVRKHRI